MFNALLYPYVAPSVSLSLNPSAGIREYGNPVSSVILNSNITLGSESSLQLQLKRGSTTIHTSNINNQTSYSFTYDASSDPIDSTTTFSVQITDSTSSKSASQSYTFVYPYYWGIINNSTAEADDVKSQNKVVSGKTNVIKKFTCTDAFPFLAIPSSWGQVSSIFDANEFNVTSSFNLQQIKIVGLDSTEVDYNVYVLNTPTSITDYQFRFVF